MNPQSEKSAEKEEKNPKGISEATKRPDFSHPKFHHQPGIKLKLSKGLATPETDAAKPTFEVEVPNVVSKKKNRRRTSKNFEVSFSSSDEDDDGDVTRYGKIIHRGPVIRPYSLSGHLDFRPDNAYARIKFACAL